MFPCSARPSSSIVRRPVHSGSELIEARRRKGVGDSFSLLFRSRTRPGIDGGIYRLEHRSLGTFELFVSPVGRGVKGLDLEAVVNRITT